MTKLVLTAIGNDREGLVSALSSAVADHGGNWLDSQFVRMAGTFSGIVLVELDEANADDLREAAAGLFDSVGWKVDVTAIDELPSGAGATTVPESDPLTFHLVGDDRPGMVKQVTEALAGAHATIDDFHSFVTPTPQAGGMLFEAHVEARIGEQGSLAGVREALESIANELMVDVDYEDDGWESDTPID